MEHPGSDERLGRLEADVAALAERVERVAADVRAVLSVNAELCARNVALTPGAKTVAVTAANTVAVREGPEGAGLIANSSTYAMRAELKRVGASWVTDAPARWVVPPAAWAENEARWSSTFNITFVRGASAGS
jgi:hypothetical protein